MDAGSQVLTNHTFLDESFGPGKTPKPFVSVHFKGDADLAWLAEVAHRVSGPGREVKYASVREVLKSGDRDLATRIHRGVGQAAIIIADE